MPLMVVAANASAGGWETSSTSSAEFCRCSISRCKRLVDPSAACAAVSASGTAGRSRSGGRWLSARRAYVSAGLQRLLGLQDASAELNSPLAYKPSCLRFECPCLVSNASPTLCRQSKMHKMTVCPTQLRFCQSLLIMVSCTSPTAMRTALL